jgi:hypothetical protein
MTRSLHSYWELVEPLYLKIDYGNGGEAFAASITDLNRPSVLLFAAHMCLAEVHNGGFLQLFWNNTGVLVPEAEQGFSAIGMPAMAALVGQASRPLGSPYPRDRDERWHSLQVASGRTSKELKLIFKKNENLYLAFEEVTATLPFDSLNEQFWESAKTENGGFQDAATRYAQSVYLIQ